VLEGAIKYRWNGLTADEKDGFYIWDVIQRILKRDLSWQEFILNYLGFVSKLEASDIMCENFMAILK
uniref:Uncharacterized protein n=1 Tax=Cannabis sativa TaxID=3483 RepID=A0A803QSG0_CANSA